MVLKTMLRGYLKGSIPLPSSANKGRDLNGVGFNIFPSSFRSVNGEHAGLSLL